MGRRTKRGERQADEETDRQTDRDAGEMYRGIKAVLLIKLLVTQEEKRRKRKTEFE